ncbi:nucleotidyltransferase domain-containing protein [Actinokineospora sp. UTMC 2448]|uniref:nucleotidyltransferase domain-containing protein n=1 Tax=Actinokineospora sp. UTMC 2448 TaxID=2268449 RepID=UPI002164CFA4|nr:nucleotidyltransferase domain-containing protein [Actinokineospora sp. UTMC 2448]UVS77023.1 putative nucleotidyltransferase [Actinokineospora sp. UTMC 2448]
MTLTLPDLTGVVAGLDRPPLFATVSGAHLYGFPSADSDIDLRGVHLLPVAEVVGLRTGPETVDHTWHDGGIEIDLVTHDLRKFARLLLKPNGYVLEQLLSPLVVTTSDTHAALVALAPRLVTSGHVRHYLGFAQNQRRLLDRSGELKPLLYAFRVLLTGIHLMRTGEVQADLRELAGPAYLGELIDAKREGEHRALAEVPGAPGRDRLDADLDALTAELGEAAEASRLPEAPTAFAELDDLVIQARLATR